MIPLILYTYCNYGWSLSSGDLDGDGFSDLLVGSPFAPSGGEQRGFVSAYFAHPAFDELTSISVLDADWRYDGHMVSMVQKKAWKRGCNQSFLLSTRNTREWIVAIDLQIINIFPF